jgi:hypothetical protein
LASNSRSSKKTNSAVNWQLQPVESLATWRDVSSSALKFKLSLPAMSAGTPEISCRRVAVPYLPPRVAVPYLISAVAVLPGKGLEKWLSHLCFPTCACLRLEKWLAHLCTWKSDRHTCARSAATCEKSSCPTCGTKKAAACCACCKKSGCPTCGKL